MTHFTVAVSWQIRCTILCTRVVWVSLVQHWMIRSTAALLWMILSTAALLWMILSTVALPWMIPSIVVVSLLIPSTGILCTETLSTKTLCTGDQLWMLIGGCLLYSRTAYDDLTLARRSANVDAALVNRELMYD